MSECVRRAVNCEQSVESGSPACSGCHARGTWEALSASSRCVPDNAALEYNFTCMILTFVMSTQCIDDGEGMMRAVVRES